MCSQSSHTDSGCWNKSRVISFKTAAPEDYSPGPRDLVQFAEEPTRIQNCTLSFSFTWERNYGTRQRKQISRAHWCEPSPAILDFEPVLMWPWLPNQTYFGQFIWKWRKTQLCCDVSPKPSLSFEIIVSWNLKLFLSVAKDFFSISFLPLTWIILQFL